MNLHAETLKRGKSVATYWSCPARLCLSLAPGCTRLYTDTNGKPYVVEYGRLKDTNGLRAGMKVESNTIIGHVAPAFAGLEASLFLEIRRNGSYFDPAKALTGSGAIGDTF